MRPRSRVYFASREKSSDVLLMRASLAGARRRFRAPSPVVEFAARYAAAWGAATGAALRGDLANTGSVGRTHHMVFGNSARSNSPSRVTGSAAGAGGATGGRRSLDSPRRSDECRRAG